MILVESLGGPLIVVPISALAAWEGADPPTHGRKIEVSKQFDPSKPATDYDRACAIGQGPGVLSIGEVEALVLSSEVRNAVWLPRDKRGRGNVFLSQLTMDDEDQFQKSVVQMVDRELPPSRTVWRVQERTVRLFDSAMPGTDIVTAWEDIELQVGEYEVRTTVVNMRGVAEVFLHQLVRRE